MGRIRDGDRKRKERGLPVGPDGSRYVRVRRRYGSGERPPRSVYAPGRRLAIMASQIKQEGTENNDKMFVFLK